MVLQGDMHLDTTPNTPNTSKHSKTLKKHSENTQQHRKQRLPLYDFQRFVFDALPKLPWEVPSELLLECWSALGTSSWSTRALELRVRTYGEASGTVESTKSH